MAPVRGLNDEPDDGPDDEPDDEPDDAPPAERVAPERGVAERLPVPLRAAAWAMPLPVPLPARLLLLPFAEVGFTVFLPVAGALAGAAWVVDRHAR